MLKPLHECKILVTPTSFGKDDPGLKHRLEAAVGEVIYNSYGRPLKSAEIQPLIRDCDGFIAGLDEINAAAIQAGTNLKVIARYGVGIDRVDLEAATRQGIVVTNTPGANSVAVAELTIGLILALARQLCHANQVTHLGEWPRISGVGLNGKTVGLLGLGAIGFEVALRLNAFHCRVLTYDPYLTAERAARAGAEPVTLDVLLREADFVSLHAPVTPGTTHIVNADFLARMKPGSFLVNTARGELVDETALVEALESGRLRGAALDCFQKEPPGADHPLLSLPQVIATPHSGAHTDEATFQMGHMALQDCLAVLRGERSEHVVNPQVFDRTGI
jgi:D-3-phosphoglycerate dehydrogenase / 2-oxoglutarate reductase